MQSPKLALLSATPRCRRDPAMGGITRERMKTLRNVPPALWRPTFGASMYFSQTPPAKCRWPQPLSTEA